MYTAWCDYGATGEGMTIMISIANDKATAKAMFENTFNKYYWPGMIVVKGIPEEVEAFVPDNIKHAHKNGGYNCYFNWTSTYHVNCS